MTFHLCPKISDLPNRLAPGWNFEIANETTADAPARESLLDAALGSARRLKTSERLREGNGPAPGLALIARDPDGALIGSLRLWPIFAGGDRPALLLGPLAVDAQVRSHGVGGGLMREALCRAVADGHRAVLLVGDAPYYGRFGFKSSYTRLLTLPGVCHVFTTASAPAQAALEAVGAQVHVMPGDVSRLDLPAVFARLAALDFNEVLAECGPTLAGALLDAGLVDELVVYIAPMVLGAEARGAFASRPLQVLQDATRWQLVDARRVGSDLRLRYFPASP